MADTCRRARRHTPAIATSSGRLRHDDLGQRVRRPEDVQAGDEPGIQREERPHRPDPVDRRRPVAVGGDDLVPTAVPHHEPRDVRMRRGAGAEDPQHEQRSTRETPPRQERPDARQPAPGPPVGGPADLRTLAEAAWSSARKATHVEQDEYERMAASEDVHWWYAAIAGAAGRPARPVPGVRRPLPRRRRRHRRDRLVAGRSGPAGGADIEPLALPLYRQAAPGRRRTSPSPTSDTCPSRPRSFDAALCVTVLYHAAIDSPPAVVAELARVVRPGGIVALLEPGVRRLRRAHDRQTHAERRFSLARHAPAPGRRRPRRGAGDGRVHVPGAARDRAGGGRPVRDVERPRPWCRRRLTACCPPWPGPNGPSCAAWALRSACPCSPSAGSEDPISP